MMNYRVVNIKEDMPSGDYAIQLMIEEINIAQFMGLKVVAVVHGYGSHGVGGIIKSRVVETLKELQHFHKIKGFILGEQWSEKNELCQTILEICPDLELSQHLHLRNAGVTVILV